MNYENGRTFDHLWQRMARRLPPTLWNLNLALLDQAFISAVNFATGVLTARYLGIAEFGRYVLAFTVVLGVNIFQQALIIDPMLSIGSKKARTLTGPYFSALLLHQAALSLGLSLVILAGIETAGAVFPSWNIRGLELPLVLAIAAGQWQEFMRRHFFARRQIGMATANDTIRYGAQIVAILTLVRWNAGGTTGGGILLIIAASSALALLHAAWFFGPIVWRREVIRSSIIEHWRFSRWLVPYAALQAVNGSTFIWAVGYFHGAPTAGALRAAHNPLGIMHIAFLGMENIMQVRAAHAYGAHGRAALRGTIEKLAIAGGLAIIVCLALLCLNAHWLLRLFYGDQYLGIDYLFYSYAAGYAVIFFAIPMRIGLRAMEVTKPLFISEGLQFGFTIATVYPLTKYLGALGAVVGFVTCSAIVVTYFGVVLSRLLRRGASASAPRASAASTDGSVHVDAESHKFDLTT